MGGSGGGSPTSTAGAAGPNVVYEGEPDGGPDWVRDNALGSSDDGETAVHPPALFAGDEATMEFDCGGERHTQIAFSFRQLEAHSAATTFITFSVDGISRETLRGKTIPTGFDDSWKSLVFNVPQDTQLTNSPWRPKTMWRGRSCSTRFPAGTKHRGWSPITESALMGVSFRRPSRVIGSSTTRVACTKVRQCFGRPQCPRETASVEVDCDGIEHTQVSFLFRQLEAHSAATTFVESSIDGIPRETLRGKTIPSGFDDSWKLLIFNVPPDTHLQVHRRDRGRPNRPFWSTHSNAETKSQPSPMVGSPLTRSSFRRPSRVIGSSTTRVACTKVRRCFGRPQCPRETQLPWRWTAMGSSTRR